MTGQTHGSGAAGVVLYRAWNYIVKTVVHQRTVKRAIPLRRQWELVISSVWAVALQTITGNIAYDNGHVVGDANRRGR
jgi:hypothetical protein